MEQQLSSLEWKKILVVNLLYRVSVSSVFPSTRPPPKNEIISLSSSSSSSSTQQQTTVQNTKLWIMEHHFFPSYKNKKFYNLSHFIRIEWIKSDIYLSVCLLFYQSGALKLEAMHTK